MRALILEDDKQFATVVKLRLLAWKPELELLFAERVSLAREALERVSRGTEASFDFVILDQHLPDGLGLELLEHPALGASAVLAVSADDTPEIPAQVLRAGAQHFLGKRQVTTPLFIPLLEALIARKRMEGELLANRLQRSKIDTIRVLLQTLRHEINNPLGAVLGGAYLVRSSGQLEEEQAKALRLIEQSGRRIKHVLEQLCETAQLEQVTKGSEEVFQVPGDPKWEKE